MIKLLTLYIYFISCGPGRHAYSQYGHTAIQVVDSALHMDVCFNYGFFSFSDKNFYTNFIKGRTYYELLIEDTQDFYVDCAYEGREIMKQELNLTEQKKIELVRALFINALPENTKYLYNFVYDNCATRPYRLVKKTLGDTILSTYRGYEEKTYRQFLQHYNRKGSWLDLGINLIFGTRADVKMKGEDRLFLPEELMFFLNEAYYNDGTPLVKTSSIHNFAIQPVRWYQTWYLGLGIYVFALFLLTIADKRRRHLSIIVDGMVGVAYLFLLVLVTYLTFFSFHPLVGFSWRLFIFPIIHLCIRSYYFLR